MLRQAMMNRAFLPVRTSRRAFLIGATAVAGGFAVGFRPVGALAQEAAAEAINPLAAYVTITADDRVTVISSQFDMGEGSYHGTATLVLEELGARWDQTDVVGGSGGNWPLSPTPPTTSVWSQRAPSSSSAGVGVAVGGLPSPMSNCEEDAPLAALSSAVIVT